MELMELIIPKNSIPKIVNPVRKRKLYKWNDICSFSLQKLQKDN